MDCQTLSLSSKVMATAAHHLGEDEPFEVHRSVHRSRESAARYGRILSDLERSALMEKMWTREKLRAIAAADRERVCEHDGLHSTASWVASKLGIGYYRAEEMVNVALALDELPLLEKAYLEGEFSFDHLRFIAQVTGPYNEKDMVEAFRDKTVSQTYHEVEKIKKVSSSDSIEARGQRYLHLELDKTTRMLQIYGHLPEEQGTMLGKAIDGIARLIPDDPDLYGETSLAMKRADALVELCQSYLSRKGPRAQLVVHVDHEALQSGEGAAEVQGGPMVSPATAQRLSCDSFIEVVVSKEGLPMYSTKLTQDVPERLRREIFRRDVHCRFTGCTVRTNLHIHHIERGRNRVHTPQNLVLMCTKHHHAVHEGGHRVHGRPPGVIRIQRPDGTLIPVGPPKPWPELEIDFMQEYLSGDDP